MSKCAFHLVKRYTDYRIGLLPTMDLIASKTCAVLFIGTYVGTKRAIYIFGKRVWRST